MTRKPLKQVAKEARSRTEKWRADRIARKVPEARQIDKAVLMAMMHVASQGPTMLIDEQRFNEALRLAIRLLVRWRCDGKEAVEMVKNRLGAFQTSTEIRDMLWEAERGA